MGKPHSLPLFSLSRLHNSANIVDRLTMASTIFAGVPCAFVISQGTGTHFEMELETIMQNRSITRRALAVCTLFFLIASSSHAATILKLDLGNVAPDVGMSAGGIYGTVSDGNAATVGDQNTAIEFTSFLDPGNPDVTTPTGSFTLSNLGEIGPATVVGTTVVQNFLGGNFSVFSPANVLLLSGTLNGSTLTGPIGPPGTGALFSTSFGIVTGGTLAPQIVPGSIALSINMTNVNNGAGFAVGGQAAPILLPFLADASVSIIGDPVPEPASLSLIGMGAIAFTARRRAR
jgi:hypothetical protein